MICIEYVNVNVAAGQFCMLLKWKYYASTNAVFVTMLRRLKTLHIGQLLSIGTALSHSYCTFYSSSFSFCLLFYFPFISLMLYTYSVALLHYLHCHCKTQQAVRPKMRPPQYVPAPVVKGYAHCWVHTEEEPLQVVTCRPSCWEDIADFR